MAFNSNIRITPHTGGLLSGLSKIGSDFAEQSGENFSQFFGNWMQEKKARENELRIIIEKLKENEPLEELNQKRSNEDIQGLIGEIAKMKEENRKAGSFNSFNDDNLIKITSRANQLIKKFKGIRQTEEMFKKGEEIINKDMGKTIDREAFYDIMLKTWETGEYPKDEEGRPVPLFKQMPKDYEAEFIKLNNSRHPIKKFKEYRNGMAIDVWTYDVNDTQRRDAAIGLLSDKGLKEGADMMFGRLGDAGERTKAAVSQGVNPTEVYLAEKAKKELWQDKEVSRPLTEAERERLGFKKTGEDKDKRDIVKKQGDSWNLHAKPIKLTGYKGAKELYVTALKYGQPPGTMAEGLYFEVYKKPENITEESKVEYIPYNEISSMVEKSVKFEGLEEAKKGAKPISYENPSATDMSKLNPNLDEWDQYLRK